MEISTLGEYALSALAGGGTTVATAWKFFTGFIEKEFTRATDYTDYKIKELKDNMAGCFERMQDDLQEQGIKCSKLENSDGQTQINLLKNLREMADKSESFRESLRNEFISKDAVEGKILRIIADHCHNCPRRAK